MDLRERDACVAALAVDGGVDEVYQLAADMGGMGFIHSAECEIMRNNALINLNMIDAAVSASASRYFFSSPYACIRDMEADEPEMDELGAYPAWPDNEYGWEKLYAERVAEAMRVGMVLRYESLASRTVTAGRYLDRRSREGARRHLPEGHHGPDGGTIESGQRRRRAVLYLRR